MLPKISIVIPNYNSGKTLNKTLQSLVDQNYDNLEIIVVDGGSVDESVDIIQTYSSHITWWVSELDLGQSNAINKGFLRCSGDIVNWLCSDDVLTPNALAIVAQYFVDFPGTDVLVGSGSVECIGRGDKKAFTNRTSWLRTLKDTLGLRSPGMVLNPTKAESITAFTKCFRIEHLALMPAQCSISQPSCFYRRALLDRTPPVDESYNYAMDTELWNYFKAHGAKWCSIDDVLSISIQDGQNKTSTGGYKVALELERIYRNYSNEFIPLSFWQKHLRYPLEKQIMKNPDRLLLVLLASSLWLVISIFLSPFYGVDKVKAMRWTNWV